ncbi:MAG TPA: adenosine kinase [Rhizomicrobium sp.]|nr:adenosine kinase [Rhizomicrobium sp.]
MDADYHVAALGNAIVDVIYPTNDEFLLKHNIAKGVMTLIDEHRAEILVTAMSGGREIAGGSAANTMAGLASLGARGLFIGKVKDDRLGESFAASMRETGVSFLAEASDMGASTACCLIAVTPDGHRSMNTYLGASREIAPADIDTSRISHSEILYIEGYLWDAPQAKSAITKAIRAAKRAGRRVAFTLSDPFCVGRHRAEFLDLMKEDLDIVFANEDEASALFETARFDETLQRARNWRGIMALTRSEKGCVVVRDDELHVLNAAPVERVIDTTGAGDQFAAGFLYGLTHDKTLEDCGRLGAITAAEVIAHYGARPETSLARLAKEANLD